MEVINFFRRGDKEKQEARERLQESKREVQRLIKRIENDLRKSGDRTTLSYSADRDITLRYALEPAYPPYPEKFQSKGSRIRVLDTGQPVVSFTRPQRFEWGVFTEWIDVEGTQEYKLAKNLPRMMAEELELSKLVEPPVALPLEEKIKIAMELAKPCPDARYNRDYG